MARRKSSTRRRGHRGRNSLRSGRVRAACLEPAPRLAPGTSPERRTACLPGRAAYRDGMPMSGEGVSASIDALTPAPPAWHIPARYRPKCTKARTRRASGGTRTGMVSIAGRGLRIAIEPAVVRILLGLGRGLLGVALVAWLLLGIARRLVLGRRARRRGLGVGRVSVPVRKRRRGSHPAWFRRVKPAAPRCPGPSRAWPSSAAEAGSRCPR